MKIVATGHEVKIQEFREYTYKTANYFWLIKSQVLFIKHLNYLLN